MKKGKVICAMSGGVDSSVSAALLKENGFEVIAVFMRMHEHSNPKDARKVAKILNIPFYILDVRKEFKKRIINYFIKEYKKGNTPNPCVMCNKYIKFKFLIDKMTELKADFVATGHYARIGKSEIQNPKSKTNSKLKTLNPKLLTAKDTKKDQSYFLWTLKRKQLAKIIFPIGDYTKEQVRGLAKKFGLPVFNKKDSQEICFIDTCIEDFLKKYIKARPGPIIAIDNKKVGEHKGLIFYTIGQRKGLPATPASWLAWRAGNPVYVIKKDLKKNALIISKSNKDLLRKEMLVKKVNWISSQPFSGKCKVKIRSMAKMVPCNIFKIQNSKFKIIFLKPQRAITPGQSAVFYAPAEASAKAGKVNEVLGGGIID
jgi:tRNA-specific 2-thiouridylase